jgi:pilus assembly protein CpaB
MRKTIVFILAVIMAGITTYLFYQYMKGMSSQSVSASSIPMTTVVEAKVTISENTMITDKMVDLVRVPKANVLPDALTSIDKVTGQRAKSEIEPKEVILSHQLVSPKEVGDLSYKVQPGLRAITVTPKTTGDMVANLIEPGDRVDLFCMTKGKTSVIVANVLVLAVDQRMGPSSPSDPYKPYTMTTLEVKPDEVLKILNAEQNGSLTFSLHSADEGSKEG